MYFLQSAKGQALLKARETGTTVTGIKQAEFRKIEIEIPEYECQTKIAGILGLIDKKITLNNEVNDNLCRKAAVLQVNDFPEKCTRRGQAACAQQHEKQQSTC